MTIHRGSTTYPFRIGPPIARMLGHRPVCVSLGFWLAWHTKG
jgi:hypothetical protein